MDLNSFFQFLPEGKTLATVYDEILEGLQKHPTEIRGAKDKELTKLEQLAAQAPTQIPEWFDYFLDKPTMPQPPKGAESLPANLQELGQTWLQEPFEMELITMEEGDRRTFSEFQKKWLEYYALIELAEKSFEIARYFLWRSVYANMMLHTLNVRSAPR